MDWIIIVTLLLSVLNLYFYLKRKANHSFEQELEEFRTYTESLITEFNRIATRNISLLDERIEELDHKIRRSQKIDILLKERFEEAKKFEYLKEFHTNETHQKKLQPENSNDLSILKEEEHTEEHIKHLENETYLNEAIDKIKQEAIEDSLIYHQKEPELINKTSIKKTEPVLFEGIPIEKLKKSKENNPKKKNQDLLIQYIIEQKSKEELLDMGFSVNEINLASLFDASNYEEN